MTAAAFHSDLWGLGLPTGGYDLLTLPSMRQQKYHKSQFRELNSRSELADYARRCDTFVALAHPGDPASLNSALDHCEVAKRAGALTVLLAAEALPDPEHGQTGLPRIFDRRLHLSGRPQPDAVFNFMTLEPYMEMANVASLFGLLQDRWCSGVDFGDLVRMFEGKHDAVKLEGMAHGSRRGYLAAMEACRHITRGTLAGRPIKGAFCSVVVDSNFKFDEVYTALEVFQAALSSEEWERTIVAVVPARSESKFMGVTALVTV